MTNDNDSPRRAADGLLRQTVPSHGAHAGPSAHSAPVDAAGPGSFVIPSRAVPSAERPTNLVEAKTAINVTRKGATQAAEGLAQRTAAEQNFSDEFGRARANSTPVYESRVAYGRSPLADGTTDSGNPAWVDDRAQMFYFAGATGDAGMRGAGQPSLSSRSSESQVGTDLSRLDLRERPGNQFSRAAAFNPRRPNDAEVRD